jgi:glycosyltransferase involved in cell wall biosynthesis
MTIHLIYPHDPNKMHAAPWSIGYNLARYLRRHGHHVIQYDWDERRVIDPTPGDILIGHPHPEAGYVFRNSLCGPWKWTASIAPWNGSEEYRANQEYVWDRVDHHFGICGKPWWWTIGPSETTVDCFTRLDMAIDPHFYPQICTPRAPAERSRVLYIGCTIDHLKGTDRLAALAESMPAIHFGHLGYGSMKGVESHGFVDLTSDGARDLIKSYDFLIAPGRHDANTTAVPEAMCWGLPPIMSTGCGWGKDIRGFHLPENEQLWPVTISEAMEAPETELRTIIRENRTRAETHYNWDRFGATVNQVIGTATGARECQVQKLSA